MCRKRVVKIRFFAQLLGCLVAACPAVAYGWMYTKQFERQKLLALTKSNGNFDKYLHGFTRKSPFDIRLVDK